MNPLPRNSVVCFLKNKPWIPSTTSASTTTADLRSLKSYESMLLFLPYRSICGFTKHKFQNIKKKKKSLI